jgi:hypothetical protein
VYYPYWYWWYYPWGPNWWYWYPSTPIYCGGENNDVRWQTAVTYASSGGGTETRSGDRPENIAYNGAHYVEDKVDEPGLDILQDLFLAKEP